jgi:hypothetical protein
MLTVISETIKQLLCVSSYPKREADPPADMDLADQPDLAQLELGRQALGHCLGTPPHRQHFLCRHRQLLVLSLGAGVLLGQ